MSNNNKKKKEEEKKAIIPEDLRPDKPGEPPKKEKKPPVLPSIELTKSQRKLWIDKVTEIGAMRQQAMSIVNQLGAEIKRNLVELFAEENGVEMGVGKRGFDTETMKFVDANELLKKQGQPRMTFPGRNA